MYTFDAKETKNKGVKIQALLRLSVWKLLERIEF